MILYSGFNMYF